MSLAENVKHYRSLAGLTQAELASRVGVRQNTIAAIESGVTKNTRYLHRIAVALGCQPFELDATLGPNAKIFYPPEGGEVIDMRKNPDNGSVTYVIGAKDQNDGILHQSISEYKEASNLPDIYKNDLPRDIPVLGISVGGDDADFTFNGNTIDYLRRPPGLVGKKHVYGLYVDNDSMWPRFAPGDPVYVDPHRRPANGDDAIIELHPAPGEAVGRGFIKRVVRRTPTKLIVEQFNPPKNIEFDLSEVASLHRVIPLMELIGF